MARDGVWLRRLGVALGLSLLLCLAGCRQDVGEKKLRHTQRGEAYYAAGKSAEAIIEFRNVVQLDPQDAQGHFQLALAYVKEGGKDNIQEGFRALRHSVQLDPTHPEAQLRLGEFYLLARQFKEAQEHAEDILARHPQHLQAQVLLANAYAGQKKMDEAVTAFERALHLDPQRVKTYRNMAAMYRVHHDVEHAEKTYQAALALQPDDASIHHDFGTLYDAQAQFVKAVSHHQRAVTLAPASMPYRLAFASSYLRQGNDAEAEKVYQAAVATARSDPTALLALGDFYSARNRFDEAKAAFVRAAEIDASSTQALVKLAELALLQRQFAAAAQYAERLLARPEAEIDGRFIQGRLAFAQGDQTTAIAVLEEVVKRRPELAAAYDYLGRAYLQTQQWHVAKVWFTKALKVNPRYGAPRIALGRMLVQDGEFDQAIHKVHIVLDYEPTNAEAYIVLGRAYAGKEEFDKAHAHFQRARMLVSDDPTIHLQLGHLAMLQNRQAEAARSYQRALELAPESAPVHRALGTLYATQKAWGKAETSYRQAIALRPHDTQAYGQLARLYGAQKRLPEVEKIYREAMVAAPQDVGPYVALGMFYTRTERLAPAIEVYEQAMQQAPMALEPLVQLTELALRRGDVTAVSTYIEQLQHLPHGKEMSRYFAGRFALAQQRIDAAVVHLREALLLRPDFALAHYALGQAYQRNRQAQLAKGAWLAAVRWAPHLLEPRIALLAHYLQDNEYDRAIVEAGKILALQPQHVSAQVMLGRAYLGKGEISQAINTFTATIAQDAAHAGSHYYLGKAYRTAQQETKALAAFEQALALQPHLIDALAQITAIYMAQGKPQQALMRVRAHRSIVSESPDFSYLLGKVHLALHDEKAAETAWRRAIDLDQNHLLSYYQLASLYMQMCTYDQAVRHYTIMSREHPRLASPQMLLGMLHDMQGDHRTANARYQQALAIHPGFAPAANNLAWNYVQHGGELTTALTLAETAYKALPDNPNVLDTLGWVHYRHEDYRQAVRFLRKSVKQLTDDPVAHYHLGMAYAKRGDKELARESLRRALQLGQAFPGAEEALRVLRVLEG